MEADYEAVSAAKYTQGSFTTGGVSVTQSQFGEGIHKEILTSVFWPILFWKVGLRKILKQCEGEQEETESCLDCWHSGCVSSFIKDCTKSGRTELWLHIRLDQMSRMRVLGGTVGWELNLWGMVIPRQVCKGVSCAIKPQTCSMF